MAIREKAVEIPEKIGACVPLDQEKVMTLYKILHEMMDEF